MKKQTYIKQVPDQSIKKNIWLPFALYGMMPDKTDPT